MKNKLLLFTAICLSISSANVNAVGGYSKPLFFYGTAALGPNLVDNYTYTSYFNYVQGVDQAIKTLQEYKILAKTICTPDSVHSYDSALKAINYKSFPETDSGGIVFIYTALANMYPCK